MYSAEQFGTAENAAQTALEAAAAYKALLAFYANERNAASHIISLTTYNVSTTMSTMANNNNSSGASGSNETSFEDDTLATGNSFYASTRLEGDMVTEGLSLSGSAVAGSTAAGSSSASIEMPIWLIPSYSVILLCAIVGNLLVISTLVQNRRMRTITNVFLLNLAISDMLLGVLCMPVTLVGTLLRNFIFGKFLCKLIQFSQAASVAVSSWTLVAISCERYYAICHPLRSRSWQTISHAYKIIGFIWLGGILCMTPIAVFSQLIPTSRPGYCKCREIWPDQGYERFYNILLDLILLVLPLIILCVAYILITRTLYVGMGSKGSSSSAGVSLAGGSSSKANEDATNSSQISVMAAGSGAAANAAETAAGTVASCVLVVDAKNYGGKSNSVANVSEAVLFKKKVYITAEKASSTEHSNNNNGGVTTATTSSTATTTTAAAAAATTTTTTTTTLVALCRTSPSLRVHDAALRRSNEAKTLESKKRVVKMLFVLVLEFFICWTPLYVINTLGMFIGAALYEYIDYTSISYLQLLAYSSSCCNPITYCFMNAGFRRAFVDTFKGLPWRGGRSGTSNAAFGFGAAASNASIGHGTGTWRTRSRHEMVSLALGAGNSLVQTNSAVAADSPRL